MSYLKSSIPKAQQQALLHLAWALRPVLQHLQPALRLVALHALLVVIQVRNCSSKTLLVLRLVMRAAVLLVILALRLPQVQSLLQMMKKRR